ncbi:MAG: type IV secretory system conjugative DNA transfer family protein, partial [Acidimicrobiales bacterium]
MASSDPGLHHLHHSLVTAGARIYIGTGGGGLAFAEPQHAVLVLGPPRSGKTTALMIPNVLAAPGAVVSTSTKADVLHASVGSRSELVRCWLLDPSGTVNAPHGVTRLRWSPVCAAGQWNEA